MISDREFIPKGDPTMLKRAIARSSSPKEPPMTSKLDPQELERLSKAATQARQAYELDPNAGTQTAFMNAESAFAWALAALYRTGQLVPAMPSASCDLCAAECRGHPLGDSAAWEPEPGSREWARRNPAMPSGDVVEAVDRDEAFCDVVWSALKGDHNDLRRQQIILRAFRAALGEKP